MSSTDFPQTPATPDELPGSEDDRDDEEYVPLDEPDVAPETPENPNAPDNPDRPPQTQTAPAGALPERYH